MNDRKTALEIPLSDADKLLRNGDGLAALLYIYLLRRNGGPDLAGAARFFGRSTEEIASALGELRALGLVGDVCARRLPPPDELPEYDSHEILTRSAQDTSFTALLGEVQHLFGRMLSDADVKRLFGIYDYLGLPCEVILLLVNHCVEVFRAKNGAGRLPTMRIIEKEAYVWANREILTLSRAEAHLKSLRQRATALEHLCEALQITGRALTPTEQKYAESWLELGFPVESLALAYDRTVVNTGRLTWKYMDSIVRSWHEKGLHTPEEIEQGDGRRRADRRHDGAHAAARQDDAERMRRMLDRLKND